MDISTKDTKNRMVKLTRFPVVCLWNSPNTGPSTTKKIWDTVSKYLQAQGGDFSIPRQALIPIPDQVYSTPPVPETPRSDQL